MLPGIYLHVPFCRSKCRYCGFFSVASGGDPDRWLAALATEADFYRPRWSAFDTCYVGGGTPSALADGQLDRLVEIVAGAFGLTAEAERTLEVNPSDVSPARARRWRALGFDRLSVGVQSFRDPELVWLGRRHDAATAARCLTIARAAGFENLSVDLIQGLPGQTVAERLESLARALDHEPAHLSCYELTVEPATPLHGDVRAGRVRLPDGDQAAEGYLAVAAELARCGFDHYEVSSFARSARTRSRHNGKYWRHVPTLGLGPAAHGFDGRRRWANVRSVERYCEAWQGGVPALAHEEELAAEELRWERVALGLRTAEGIAVADLAATAAAERASEELAQQGLLVRDGERLRPTTAGYLVADAMARRLLFDDAAGPREP